MTLEITTNPEPIGEFVASRQASLFKSLKESQFTGQLLLKDSYNREWFFYLYMGRIIYATGGVHTVRRYKRNISVYLPQMVFEYARLENEPAAVKALDLKFCWEYELLCIWNEQKSINRDQFSKMISNMVIEILFDLTQQAKQVYYELKPDKSLSTPLVLIDPDQVIVESWKLWQSWQGAKVADRSPNSSPVITQAEQLRLRTSEKTFLGMTKLLGSKRTLRDIAAHRQQDVKQITTLLMPYIQLGLIELVEVSDLKPIFEPVKPKPVKKFLIVCVDDSPLISQTMEKLITEAGYEFLGINDDLRAIAKILNKKPDLIFLDLVMPHISGEEICRQLRKVPEYTNTPIIILTANWGLLSRIRGKMVGCSDFLSKPIEPEVVLALIAKYLQPVNQPPPEQG